MILTNLPASPLLGQLLAMEAWVLSLLTSFYPTFTSITSTVWKQNKATRFWPFLLLNVPFHPLFYGFLGLACFSGRRGELCLSQTDCFCDTLHIAMEVTNNTQQTFLPCRLKLRDSSTTLGAVNSVTWSSIQLTVGSLSNATQRFGEDTMNAKAKGTESFLPLWELKQTCVGSACREALCPMLKERQLPWPGGDSAASPCCWPHIQLSVSCLLFFRPNKIRGGKTS